MSAMLIVAAMFATGPIAVTADVTDHQKADELRPYLAAALYYDSPTIKKESAK